MLEMKIVTPGKSLLATSMCDEQYYLQNMMSVAPELWRQGG